MCRDHHNGACVSCGNSLPDTHHHAVCSMCYGDPGYGTDGYAAAALEADFQRQVEREQAAEAQRRDDAR